MALLNFPLFPVNGQIYPSNPIVGEKVYEWSTQEQTWILLGLVTGVVPGVYGTPLSIPQFRVNWAGRIESVEDIPIQVADTTQIGITRLGTLVETEDGTLDSIAVTPLGLRTSAVYKSDFLAKGDILSASGAGVPLVLPAAPDGQILVTNSSQATGLKWTSAPEAGLVVGVTGVSPISVDNTVPSEPVISLDDTTVVPGTYSYTSFTVDEKGRLTFAATNTTPNTTVIAPILNTGTTVEPIISLDNTTVTPGSYDYASFTVDEKGRLTAAATNTTPNTTVIAPILNTGTTVEPIISLADTSVVPGTYNYSSFTVDEKGRLTFAATNTTPNTTVIAPILNTGTTVEPIISLADTSVVPGTYNYSSFTVDQKGRLTFAATNTTPNTTVVAPITNTGTTVEPVIGVDPASTSSAGVVQLNDTTTSTSTTEALTAAQGKKLQDQITSLVVGGGLTNAGTFNASTGLMTNVSVAGAAAGFVIGQDVPSPAPALLDYFVQITVAGTYSPPGGGGPYDMAPGDWLFCNGTNWIQVEIGTRLPYASTTEPGAVELSTNAETQAGTDATRAVTPASLQSKVSNSVSTTSSTRVASSTAVKTAYDLANAALPLSGGTMTGVINFAAGQTLPVGGIQDASATAKGVVQIGTNIQVASGVISVRSSSTTQSGVVQLNDGLTSTSTTQAATANAARQLNVIAAAKVASVTGTAPITVNNTTPTAPVVGVSAASTTASGVVQLNNTVTSTSTTQAATANAVKTAYDAAQAVSPVLAFLDSLTFNGSTTAFTLRIGGVAVTPGSNLLVFVGGVPQIPGTSYSVSGSTITFTEAPPTNASFIAVTATKA